MYGLVACSFMKAIVFSSTWKMPFFAPASIAMLAIENRESMERAVYRVARVLHRLVQCAVNADHADDVEDQVLAGHPFAAILRSNET